MKGRREQMNAVRRAIEAGICSDVEALCAVHPGLASATNSHGNGPLGWAIDARQLDIANLLIRLGADPVQRNRSDWSLMDRAAGHGGEPFVALLRKNGAAYELRHAIGLGDLSTIAVLLDAEPSLVDCPDARRQNFPMHFAARAGQAGAARVLLERGAGVDPKNVEGFTPLAVLAASGPKQYRPAVALVLLQHGASPAAPCGYGGKSILGYARSKRDHALVTILTEHDERKNTEQ